MSSSDRRQGGRQPRSRLTRTGRGAARKRSAQSLLPWLVGVIAVGGLVLGIWLGVNRRGPFADPRPAASVPAADDGAQSWYGRAPGQPNRLADAASPYLRRAQAQPVNWHEWNAEAFDLARQLDRPILLDIGASWCAACDYMDQDSYNSAAVAAEINGHFIPIRVDRDARPDIDARYQAAAGVIAEASGWPLTLFLTPDGKAFSGGTSFAATSTDANVGMDRLLPSAYTTYYLQRAEVHRWADQVHGEVLADEAALAVGGELDATAATSVSTALLLSFDHEAAGWGEAGKRPDGTSIAYSLARRSAALDDAWLGMATKTLNAIAGSAIRDHVMGGIFRSTSDRDWASPHFEKICPVNAEALRNFVQAYEVTRTPAYRNAAEELIEYVQTQATDQRRGGFFASQSAGDGRYYTWTKAEVEAVLSPEEAQVVALHFGIDEPSDQVAEGRPSRGALSIAAPADQVAVQLGLPLADVEALIASAKQRLADARRRLPAPPFDQTVYASWNAQMISAYLEASRVLERPGLRDFALKTADALLDRCLLPGQGMAHDCTGEGPQGLALLEDQVLIANALVEAFEATGETRYLDAARQLMDTVLTEYADPSSGGFFVIDPDDDVGAVLQPLAKPILDYPTRAANAMAAIVLDRLAAATGDSRYSESAAETLAAFAGSSDRMGALAPTYALAVTEHLSGTTPQGR